MMMTLMMITIIVIIIIIIIILISLGEAQDAVEGAVLLERRLQLLSLNISFYYHFCDIFLSLYIK